MQWPPTPMPGLNFINPYGFDEAASRTLWTGIFIALMMRANSLTSAIFTCRKVFSNNFAASAISGVSTSIKLSQKLP